MFGLFSSSSAAPAYPEIPTPKTKEEYHDYAEKSKTTILELLATTDGWKDMDSPIKTVTLKTKEIEGSPANIARAEAVLDISVDKLVAEVTSQDGARFKAQDEDTLEWKCATVIDDNNQIIYSGHKTPFPVTNRELFYLRTKHVLPDGRTLIVGASINDPAQAPVDGRIRAVVLACWLFAPQGDSTHVTRCIQLDPKGSIPGFLINAQQAKAAVAVDHLTKACK